MTKEMSKRQKIREQRAKQQARGRLVSIVLIVAGALILFFLFLWPNLRPVQYTQIDPPRERYQVKDNTMGSPDAPITITEYSDFQCPYCERYWTDTEEQVVKSFVETNKVHYTYRSFGAFISPDSAIAAEAAYCAGDQNKFWDMHDLLFKNQGVEGSGWITNRLLDTFASAIGLDMNQYNSCMSSHKFASRVDQDGTDGAKAGVTATPSFILTYVVNGETKTKTIQGAEPFSTFQSNISDALKEMGLQ